MNISADAILTYILVAVGGFLLKVILDWIRQIGEDKNEKAKKFEEQVWKNEIDHAIADLYQKRNAEVADQFASLKAELKQNYDYWQKMYWDAVNRLNNVQEDFSVLREQDIIFYRYVLIDTCKEYIQDGQLTQYQFDRLTEWYKIYKSLGGNSQGDLYYKKAVSLPIIEEGSDQNNSIFDYQYQTTKQEKDNMKNKDS